MPTDKMCARKKCIAFVISSLRMGGAEKIASFLANSFVKEYKVVLILWSLENQFYSINEAVKVEVIPNQWRGLVGNVYKIFMLMRLFKKHGVDLSVSFIHQTNLLAILASRLSSVPVIATEHSIYNSLEGVWRILRRWIYPLAQHITTLTQKDLEHYSFLSNISVMPNPIQIEAFINRSYEDYKPYILSVGRMIPSKHFEELLESFYLFSQKHKGYSLLIAGDGVLKEKLQQQAQDLGIRVIFLGQVENLYCAYCCAEFCALTSHKEGLSNVLIESLMCGTPVVSYDCPYGPSEIIKNGENGVLVELGNKEKMAESFEIILQKRDFFARNAIQSVEKFEARNVLKCWQNLFRQWI